MVLLPAQFVQLQRKPAVFAPETAAAAVLEALRLRTISFVQSRNRPWAERRSDWPGWTMMCIDNRLYRRGKHVVWYAPVEIIDRDQPDDPPLPIKDRQPAKRLGTHDLGCVSGILVFKTRYHVPSHQVVDVRAISISTIGNQAVDNIAVSQDPKEPSILANRHAANVGRPHLSGCLPNGKRGVHPFDWD
jgi:hypothetical protein